MLSLLSKKRIPFLKILLFGFWPAAIKKLILRIRGNRIGKDVSLGFGSIILSPSIRIEDGVKIAPLSLIIADSVILKEFCSIGSFCYIDTIKLKIGSHTRIRESVMVGGNKSINSELTIGSKCLILQSTILNTTDHISIGNNSAIGGGSRLFTHSSWLSILDGYPVIQGPISIGNNVWLPYDTTVLANSNIGSDTVITPRSIINQDIPPNSIAGGNPIRVGKNYFKRTLKTNQINKIYSGIINDLVCTLGYDGYSTSEETGFYRVMKKGLDCIVLATKIKGTRFLQENTTILLLNNLPVDETCGQIKASVVYIDNKTPKVINKTKKTDLFLTFLSRYGIR